MAGTTSCPVCSSSYTDIGKHWNGSKCKYPKLTQEQIDTISGTLLGDGSVPLSPNGRKSQYKIEVCEQDFIDFISDKLSWLVSSVSRRNLEDPCRDTYVLRTVRHPELKDFRRRWYPDGSKSFPEDINLDSFVLSMWYVTDGGLSTDKRRGTHRPYISAWNERNNKDKILSYFDETPFDPYWAGDKQIYIPVNQTDKFLDWICGPVPGYEYKWTERFK